MSFFHFRDRDGFEVDIVIERGAQAVAGVEVKAGATVTASDFRGLRKLRDAAGDRFAGGVVLYDGETSAGFGVQLHAVPTRFLWETPCGALFPGVVLGQGCCRTLTLRSRCPKPMPSASSCRARR